MEAQREITSDTGIVTQCNAPQLLAYVLIFIFEGCILLCLIITVAINVPSTATEYFLLLFHSPQHVSAPTGHLQVQHTSVIFISRGYQYYVSVVLAIGLCVFSLLLYLTGKGNCVPEKV
jgi:hypothetical protein